MLLILTMIMIIRMIAILLLVLALWSWPLGPGCFVRALCRVPAAGYRAGS